MKIFVFKTEFFLKFKFFPAKQEEMEFQYNN